MKQLIRKWLWKLLGNGHHQFLKNQKNIYLADFKEAKIGKASYNNGVIVWKWAHDAELVIGNYSSIAHGVQLFLDSGFHNYKNVTTYPLFSELYKSADTGYRINGELTKGEYFKRVTQKKSIHIGSDVWIGSNAMIMPGVVISDGAVVLPGAAVSCSVGPYEIFGGVPAKIGAKRFDDELIEQLLQIKWWNWDEELIRSRIKDFYEDPSAFANKYGALCMYAS